MIVDIQPEAPPAEAPASPAEQPTPPEISAADPTAAPPQRRRAGACRAARPPEHPASPARLRRSPSSRRLEIPPLPPGDSAAVPEQPPRRLRNPRRALRLRSSLRRLLPRPRLEGGQGPAAQASSTLARRSAETPTETGAEGGDRVRTGSGAISVCSRSGSARRFFGERASERCR